MKSKLKSLYRRVRPQTINHLHKRNNLTTAIGFTVANNIEGDYLEYGVFKGASFIYAYHLYTNRFKRYKTMPPEGTTSDFLNQNVRFFAFDSFEGLPVTDDKDVPLHWTGDKPMSFPRFEFEQNLKNGKVNTDRVEIIEGFYNESITPTLYNDLNLKKAAIIHIDCDLYESTKTVLDTIRPLIVEGTVVIFDDFFYYKGSPYKGERGAFNEWLHQNPDIIATELCKFSPAATYILNFKDENVNHTIKV